MNFLICLLMGYALGSFPTAYLILNCFKTIHYGYFIDYRSYKLPNNKILIGDYCRGQKTNVILFDL